jgi:hypothetical protein
MLERTMILNISVVRRFLWAAAVLFSVISLVFLAGVIPLVKSDPYAQVVSELTMNSFWGCAAFNYVAAVVMGFIAYRVVTLTRRMALVLGFLMVVALVFAFLLSDSAFAFHFHGPTLLTVAVLLHLCAIADLLVAALIVATVVLLPKNL